MATTAGSGAMTLKLYFTPGRSWLPRWLLGEMGEPFELVTLDIQKGEQTAPAYLAVNPLGKLPALDVDGEIITETAAVCLYLADLRPEQGLAIPHGARGRGRYLSLMIHASTALEPAIEDVILKRTSDRMMVGWNPIKDELAFAQRQLGDGPYLFGDRFTAADVMMGGVLVWASQFPDVDLSPALRAYVERLMARPPLAELFDEARAALSAAQAG